MITDDDGLRITRERLALVESAIDATRRRVGDNDVQFRLLTGAMADMAREMRSDIDTYLGVATAPAASKWEVEEAPVVAGDGHDRTMKVAPTGA